MIDKDRVELQVEEIKKKNYYKFWYDLNIISTALTTYSVLFKAIEIILLVYFLPYMSLFKLNSLNPLEKKFIIWTTFIILFFS